MTGVRPNWEKTRPFVYVVQIVLPRLALPLDGMHFPLCIVVVVVVAGGLSEGARTVEVDVDGTSQTLPVFTDADMAQFDGTDVSSWTYPAV